MSIKIGTTTRGAYGFLSLDSKIIGGIKIGDDNFTTCTHYLLAAQYPSALESIKKCKTAEEARLLITEKDPETGKKYRSIKDWQKHRTRHVNIVLKAKFDNTEIAKRLLKLEKEIISDDNDLQISLCSILVELRNEQNKRTEIDQSLLTIDIDEKTKGIKTWQKFEKIIIIMAIEIMALEGWNRLWHGMIVDTIYSILGDLYEDFDNFKKKLLAIYDLKSLSMILPSIYSLLYTIDSNTDYKKSGLKDHIAIVSTLVSFKIWIVYMFRKESSITTELLKSLKTKKDIRERIVLTAFKECNYDYRKDPPLAIKSTVKSEDYIARKLIEDTLFARTRLYEQLVNPVLGHNRFGIRPIVYKDDTVIEKIKKDAEDDSVKNKEKYIKTQLDREPLIFSEYCHWQNYIQYMIITRLLGCDSDIEWRQFRSYSTLVLNGARERLETILKMEHLDIFIGIVEKTYSLYKDSDIDLATDDILIVVSKIAKLLNRIDVDYISRYNHNRLHYLSDIISGMLGIDMNIQIDTDRERNKVEYITSIEDAKALLKDTEIERFDKFYNYMRDEEPYMPTISLIYNSFTLASFIERLYRDSLLDIFIIKTIVLLR